MRRQAAPGRSGAAAAASISPPDNIATADSALVEKGPSLSGTLTPERAAQLRAQVGGALLALYVEEGSSVSAGQAVALIDTVSLAEMARSARSQLVSAQLGADVAKRNYERAQTLHAAGAISDRDLEVAHNQSVSADAVLADARSRVTTAEKQLTNAVVRAPFAGVVSERPASSGDVLQVGSPILTVVDPDSCSSKRRSPRTNWRRSSRARRSSSPSAATRNAASRAGSPGSTPRSIRQRDRFACTSACRIQTGRWWRERLPKAALL